METRIERDCPELHRYGRLRPVQRPYAEDERHDTDALAAQQDELAGDELHAWQEWLDLRITRYIPRLRG